VPDWPGFRMFPQEPNVWGERMHFESHLGHDIFPRQGRFCFDVLTKLVVASSGELGRGLWPGCRDGLFGCVGWRSGPWLVGLLPVQVRYMVPRSCSVAGRGCPAPFHGPGERLRHDFASSGANFLGRSPFLYGTEVEVRCLSGQRGCGQCPHLCLLHKRARAAATDECCGRIRIAG